MPQNDSTSESPRLCGIEYCQNPHLAMGLCNGHYQRWKNSGCPEEFCGLTPKKSEQPPKKKCGVPSCYSMICRAEMCYKHYMRWKLDGKPAEFEGFKPTIYRERGGPVKQCMVPDCDRDDWIRGLCQLHYNRWIKRDRPPLNEENWWQLGEKPPIAKQTLPIITETKKRRAWHVGLTEAICKGCGETKQIDEFAEKNIYYRGEKQLYRAKLCKTCEFVRTRKIERIRTSKRYGTPIDPVCSVCGAAVKNGLFKYCLPCRKKKENQKHARSGFNSKVRKSGYKKIAMSRMGGKCTRCGYDKPEFLRNMHFHHRDPSQKTRVMSAISTWDEYWAEVVKCDLLCANCHGEVEHQIVKDRQAERSSKRKKPEPVPPLFADLQPIDATAGTGQPQPVGIEHI